VHDNLITEMKIKKYITEAYNELMHKVTWPKWPELQSGAIAVMIASLIISLVIFLMDYSFREILEFIYNINKPGIE
jgi:preprotein translocase subunit SecE